VKEINCDWQEGWWGEACTFGSAMKIDAKQDVPVIYFFFRDVREITRSYKNTDKSEKNRIIEVIELN
jgi:hypothetical protein